MSRYRRARVPGATYLFTVNLLNRHSDLLVRHIDLLRKTVSHPRTPPLSLAERSLPQPPEICTIADTIWHSATWSPRRRSKTAYRNLPTQRYIQHQQHIQTRLRDKDVHRNKN
ncbi:hypothetical protein PstZobell_05218 [Stutzerimonas stutzeri ATCC 14405 = CCUG 16156]|nr:hypothetical protein PstZobell_05218 [Stutzerimonas stutzeri ATCC 14405 = CCUG 16156]